MRSWLWCWRGATTQPGAVSWLGNYPMTHACTFLTVCYIHTRVTCIHLRGRKMREGWKERGRRGERELVFTPQMPTTARELKPGAGNSIRISPWARRGLNHHHLLLRMVCISRKLELGMSWNWILDVGVISDVLAGKPKARPLKGVF